MAIVEAISIPIGVTGQDTVDKAANSYEDLGDAVAKTQREAERLANTFGVNDERTKEAIRVAGKYKQEMEQLDFAIDGARGGVDSLFRATQGVIAGFGLATGAMAIFGSESEDLERILVKVQGVMVFSQAVKDLKEFAPAVLQVARATREWFVSLSIVQKAFLTLGIGLVVELVVRLTDSFSDLSEETTKAAKSQEEYNQKIRDLRLERVALQQGELVATQIKLNDAQAEQNKLVARNVEILQQLARIRETERLLGEEFDVERKKALQQELKDNQLKVESLVNDELRLSKKIEELKSNDAKKAEEKKANDKKEEQAAEEAFQKWLAIEVAKAETTASNAKFLKDRLIKEYADKIKLEEDFKAKLEKSASDEAKFIDEQFLIRQLALNKSITDEKALKDASDLLEIERLNSRIQAAKDVNDSSVQLEIDLAAKKKEIKDKEADEETKRKKAVADLEQEIFNNSQALAQAIINIAGQNSKAGKAVALASIAADTAMALSGALSNANSPASPDNIATGGLAAIPKYIALATTILTNSKRAYDIIKAPAPSTAIGGGGGGGGAAAVPRFNAPTTRLQGTDEFTQVRRIYVTERDITNVQDKVRVTEGLSQF